MITKENFVFTMGYKGDTAIVDGALKSRYSTLGAVELAEKGFFKPAICSALYSNNSEEFQKILEIYNNRISIPLKDVESLKKTFGVTYLPEDIIKVEIV